MRVLLCDDHLLFLEALGAVIRGRGHDVVMQCCTPEEASQAAEALQPDTCVMDLHFPKGNAWAAIGRIKEASPRTHIVILSGDGTARSDGPVLVMKQERMETIIEAIERGDSYRPQSTFKRSVPRSRGPSTPEERLGMFLTAREMEVLKLLVAGSATTGIARDMDIAYSTARTHIQNVVTKLGVHSKVAAAAFAVRNGLVEAPVGAVGAQN